MRTTILGNSGSGKSTLANWIASHVGLAVLDLDMVAWEPGQIAVPRAPADAASEVRAFCSKHHDWVVEGCYASLASISLEFSPRLLFLNPGVEQCLANCRARPWEPHKYASKQAQDERLAFLLDWVREYYTREGDMSLSAHKDCFSRYEGEKRVLETQAIVASPSDELLAWLTQ